VDMSRLGIRQAFLQGVDAQDARLAGARLSEVVIGEAFNFSMSVTVSGDGAYVAAGSTTGSAYVWRVSDKDPAYNPAGPRRKRVVPCPKSRWPVSGQCRRGQHGSSMGYTKR
jgi:hypothetical protein